MQNRAERCESVFNSGANSGASFENFIQRHHSHENLQVNGTVVESAVTSTYVIENFQDALHVMCVLFLVQGKIVRLNVR